MEDFQVQKTGNPYNMEKAKMPILSEPPGGEEAHISESGLQNHKSINLCWLEFVACHHQNRNPLHKLLLFY